MRYSEWNILTRHLFWSNLRYSCVCIWWPATRNLLTMCISQLSTEVTTSIFCCFRSCVLRSMARYREYRTSWWRGRRSERRRFVTHALCQGHVTLKVEGFGELELWWKLSICAWDANNYGYILIMSVHVRVDRSLSHILRRNRTPGVLSVCRVLL